MACDARRFTSLAAPDWDIVHRTQYVPTWRMGELVVVPPEHEHAFRNANKAALTR